MPCVKLQRTICEGSPATQRFDCSALHGQRAGRGGGQGEAVFLWSDRRSSRIHVISCLGLPDESWAERKHILLAWVIALVFVWERERERAKGEKVRDTRYRSACESVSESWLRACFLCVCESARPHVPCLCVPLTKILAYSQTLRLTLTSSMAGSSKFTAGDDGGSMI